VINFLKYANAVLVVLLQSGGSEAVSDRFQVHVEFTDRCHLLQHF